MNPFSAFLQPPTQRSPLAGAGEFVQGLQQQALQKRAQEFREKESGLDNARADSYLKLQQSQQARSFSEADKKEIESALAEYQDAEDQGDPVRLSRAAQMLKRFGMDVSQGGMDPRAGAFTGAKPLPGMLPMVPGKGNAFTGTAPDEANLSQEAFEAQLTGETGDPIDQAVATELETREKLRSRSAAPEPDIAGHLQSVGGLKALKLNTPEQQEAEFSAKATDLGDVDQLAPDAGDVDHGEYNGQTVPKEQTSQSPQVASQMAPALPGGLPVRISKGGKQLYESTGPSGRWAPMVQGVFQAAAQHQDPEFAAAGKRAQEMATKLIGVDGIAPKDAIKFAASQLENEIQNITNYRRTELGTRPKWGGGGGAATTATIKGRKPFNDEMNRTYMQFKSEKLDEQYQGYNAGIGAISSANTASQYDALNRLIQARSGLTVSDKERAIYNNLAGMWQGWLKQFNLLSGGDLPDEYRAQLKALMNEARSAVVEEKQRRAQAAANFYRAKVRGTADPAEIEMDANELANAIMVGASAGPAQGGGGDPNADLYQ